VRLAAPETSKFRRDPEVRPQGPREPKGNLRSSRKWVSQDWPIGGYEGALSSVSLKQDTSSRMELAMATQQMARYDGGPDCWFGVRGSHWRGWRW
jgi:hypothetical protein